MKTVQVDMRKFSKTNMWRLPSGELAIRPGLRRIFQPLSGRVFIAGFSLYSQYTGETTHYIFDVASGGPPALRANIYSEDFELFQRLDLNVGVVPRGISYAVIQGMVLIGSPDMPTLFGMVGSGINIAQTVASVNTSTTALPVPRGIVTAWNNRAVIANGQSVFFGDPVTSAGGDVRTFVVENQNSIESTVFGIHWAAGGQLVAVTSGGVFGLDSANAAVQVVAGGSTAWNKLHHHEATSLESSCVVNGRTWALTRRGYMLVDTENDTEVSLDQGLQPRRYGPRYALQDYRPLRLYGGEMGPIAAADVVLATHMHDLEHGVLSWMDAFAAPFNFTVRGLLRGPDGEEMYVCPEAVVRMVGNFDGEQSIDSSLSTQTQGVLAGVMPTRPKDSPTARVVHVSTSFCSSAGGADGVHVALRGDAQDAVPPVDPSGAIIGTAAWGTSLMFLTPPLQTVAMDFDRNTDDMGIEVMADEPLTRVLTVLDMDLSDSAPHRKTGRG